MIKDGAAHHPHSLRDPKPIADFIEASQKLAAVEVPLHSSARRSPGPRSTAARATTARFRARKCSPLAADRGSRRPMTATSSASTASACPSRSSCRRRPRRASRGCSAADFVTRDAAVDLALLGRGFHIVTGPVPTDTDGPVLQQWNAVYKLLTDNGLSQDAGAGRGRRGGRRGLCLGDREPGQGVLHLCRKPDPAQPHVEDSAARTACPPRESWACQLLHVCGSRDPWLDEPNAQCWKSATRNWAASHGPDQTRARGTSRRPRGT